MKFDRLATGFLAGATVVEAFSSLSRNHRLSQSRKASRRLSTTIDVGSVVVGPSCAAVQDSASNPEIVSIRNTFPHAASIEDMEASLLSDKSLSTKEKEWVEEVTASYLQQSKNAIRSLVGQDVDTLTTLMIYWARSDATETSRSATMIEALLKLLIDALTMGNKDVFVTQTMYNCAIAAWGRTSISEGESVSSERAQGIFDGLVAIYEETGDERIAPNLDTYHVLMKAWINAPSSESVEHVEAIVEDIISNPALKPNTMTLDLLMRAYEGCSRLTVEEVSTAEHLLSQLEEHGVGLSSAKQFAILQDMYANSLLSDPFDRTMEVLDDLIGRYNSTRDEEFRPRVANLLAVAKSLLSHPTVDNAERLEQLMCKMEKPIEEGGYDVKPDSHTYEAAVEAACRCPSTGVEGWYGCLDMAQRLLQRYEVQAEEALLNRQQEDHEISPSSSLLLNVEAYNSALVWIVKIKKRDSFPLVSQMVEHMNALFEKGHKNVKPNRGTWNAYISSLKQMAKPPLDKLDHAFETMWEDYNETKDEQFQPDTYTYSMILLCLQKNFDEEGKIAAQAENLVREMEVRHAKGELAAPPEVIHYTILATTWARTNLPTSVDKIQKLIQHMIARCKNLGHKKCKPNLRTYNALLSALVRNRRMEEAERLLDLLMAMGRGGEPELAPDIHSFSNIIYSYTRQLGKPGSGAKAEAVLDQCIQFCEENPSCSFEPDARVYLPIFTYYARCSAPDAPYRAEYLLFRIIELYQSGNFPQLVPESQAFELVMDAYINKKHPDGGNAADRLLIALKRLRKDGVISLQVDTKLMGKVLHCWASSVEPAAGQIAEFHLEEMERNYAKGETWLKPDAKCYGCVLTAWARSATIGKATYAMDLVKRMENLCKDPGREDLKPNSYIYSLVINACGFANSSRDEAAESFSIATKVLEKLLAAKDDPDMEPSSLTYGWFFQMCGRCLIGTEENERWVERAFHECCKAGRVNIFVVTRIRGATLEPLFNRLFKGYLSTPNSVNEQNLHKQNQPGKDLPQVDLSMLPEEWTRRSKRCATDP